MIQLETHSLYLMVFTVAPVFGTPDVLLMLCLMIGVAEPL